MDAGGGQSNRQSRPQSRDSMTDTPTATWNERAVARSPIVRRSRDRSIEQTEDIIAAARRLIDEQQGARFSVQELAKEAGVALQTFYRHFTGKDELLLAVVEQIVAESCQLFKARAQQLPDPLSRIRFYVEAAVSALADNSGGSTRRFISAEHFRLYPLFPDELAAANRSFNELLLPEIAAANASGQLDAPNLERSVWFVTELVRSTYHHYAFAKIDFSVEELVESLWTFCLKALGGTPEPPTARTKGL